MRASTVNMPHSVRNATKSHVRSAVEHVFPQQKDRMGLYIRTVGIERTKAKISLVKFAHNMRRLIFHERRLATGWLRLLDKKPLKTRPRSERLRISTSRWEPVPSYNPRHLPHRQMTPVNGGVQLSGSLDYAVSLDGLPQS
jgi:hypothetical protein